MGRTFPIDSCDRGRPNGLLAHALGRLLGPGEPRGTSSDLLVVVASDRTPASAWLVSFLDARPGMANPDRIAVCDGAGLGRLFQTVPARRLETTLARHRLVVIDHADDVGGPDRQRALAQLLDALHASGIATCVSVATHPAANPTLEPQLASRLAAGLLVMPPAAAMLTPSITPRSSRRPPTIARVVANVARYFECSMADLLGPSRCRGVAEARSMAMYVARMVTGRSYHAVGAACGGRDHTTVIHAVRVVIRRMARDAAFAGDVARLLEPFSEPAACSHRVNRLPPRRRPPSRRSRRPSIHRSTAAYRPRHGTRQ